MRDGNDEAALSYYLRSYDTSHEAGYNRRLAGDLASISVLQMKLGRSDDALFTLERLYAVASASGMKEEVVFALDGLVKLNEGAGNVDMAAYYRKLRDEMSGTGVR